MDGQPLTIGMQMPSEVPMWWFRVHSSKAQAFSYPGSRSQFPRFGAPFFLSPLLLYRSDGAAHVEYDAFLRDVSRVGR